MDGITRMKRIRIIDKMNEDPVMRRRLGLKDRSYVREEKVTSHEIDRYRF